MLFPLPWRLEWFKRERHAMWISLTPLFTARSLPGGWPGRVRRETWAPPCSHLLVRPLSCPSVPAHFPNLSKPGSWWRGVLGPISQVGRWVWENNAETTKRARGGPAGESRLELDCQFLAWLVRLPWSGIPKSVLLCLFCLHQICGLQQGGSSLQMRQFYGL